MIAKGTKSRAKEHSKPVLNNMLSGKWALAACFANEQGRTLGFSFG